MNQKVKYLLTCTIKNIRQEGFSCPSCGSSKATVVVRKYLVAALKRCECCQLLFRTPTTNSEEYRYKEDKSWNKLWGSVHPNFLDKVFYEKVFAKKSFILFSDPYSTKEISNWKTDCSFDRESVKLNGSELLILVKK